MENLSINIVMISFLQEFSAKEYALKTMLGKVYSTFN